MNLIGSLNKPQYLLRPSQILRRLARAVLPAGEHAEVTLPWGGRLRINPHETVGRSIWHQGVHELIVSETLWRLLSPGDCAVDAGANIGYMSQLMAHRVGRSGSVLAFEPHPRIYEELRYNLAALLALPDVAVVDSWQLALSASPGEAGLLENEWFAGNRGTAKINAGDVPVSGTEILVATARLDAYLGDRQVAVLKLDVEGHELQVLEGASGALSAGRIRNIVYEDFADADESSVRRLLESHGYMVYELAHSLRRPLLTAPRKARGNQPAYETPNYLATIEPQRVASCFGPRGWCVLSKPRR